MGAGSNLKWAALTNYRQGKDLISQAPSRGELVVNYLTSTQSAESYANYLQETGSSYNGYNILLGEKENLYYQSNRNEAPQKLATGIYGLSNHLLNTPWPKVEKGKAALAKSLQKPELDLESLFSLLKNKHKAPDEKLPDTGIPFEWEKALSAMFIEMPGYGTRVSTVLLQTYSGEIYVEERAYHPVGEAISFDLSTVDFANIG